MLDQLLPLLPRDALNIALVLALTFFVGLEREEDEQRKAQYAFGGIRAFPLIGLVSYALGSMSGAALVPWTIGFGVVGGFLLVSYFHRLATDPHAHLTAEISGLASYAVGGLVQREYYWIATTLGVLSVLLLELKKALEGLTKYFASNEIITVAKFLMLSVVILPIVPDRAFTRFQLNPFKTWLVVVAVSGVSFASYVLQRVRKGRGGVMLSAILGGAYSSTVTTVALARSAKHAQHPNLYAGSILMASGLMYARLIALLALFNRALALALAVPFGGLCALGCLVGWLVARRDANTAAAARPDESKNPLALGAAFLLALVFVAMVVLTKWADAFLGRAGLYALAAVMGVSDVDPFILSLAQERAPHAPLALAGHAILIAAASNNLAKGCYAYAFADRATGARALLMLGAFAALGLIPIALR